MASEQKNHGPLRAILDIHGSEWPFALLMFSYFFLVITSFWILKPIKKSLFIEFYDQTGFHIGGWTMAAADAELLAKVLNMFVAFAAVVVFTWLARRFRRQALTFIFTVFFLASYGAYSLVLNHPGDFTVWSFYLFGDLFSTLMVATFFAFLNDSVTADEAKRIYGLVVLGGVTGGVFGTNTVRIYITTISSVDWLWICFGIGITIMVVAYAAGRLVAANPPPETQPEEPSANEADHSNPALEGARLVFRSPYLLAIVGIVGLYEIVSTVMDFQFTKTITHYLDGRAIGQQFATVFSITNAVSLIVQVFFTSLVMTRLGVGVALMVLPVAALTGSIGFMIFPALWIGSLLNTVDNGFSYSINQSAREALYVPTTKDEKYKAKAFIDMFVQRFAKALAVAVSLGMSWYFASFNSMRWLSIFSALIIIAWLFAVCYAGKHFREMTEPKSP